MQGKKALIILSVAVIAFWIISDPPGAAATVHGMLNWLKGAGQAVIQFIQNIFRG